MLSALYSTTLSVDEKLEIIRDEYELINQDEVGKEIAGMCNLSQGIKEEGIAEGIELGMERGIMLEKSKIVFNLYNAGVDLDIISKTVELDKDEIRAIIEEQQDVFV